MDLAPLVRIRWRLRGAWLWPSFIALSIVDALIVKARPILGDASSLTGAWLLGLISSLIAIVVLTPIVSRLVMRARPDMPRGVARDYAGAQIALTVTAVLLVGGLMHHSVVTSDSSALSDATARAESYIGAHAPNQFLVNLHHLNTSEVQPPSVYRTCATNRANTASWCVVVDRSKPFGQDVKYDGTESNTLLFQGAN